MRHHLAGSAALALALVLGPTACGGDDEPSSRTTTTTGPSGEPTTAPAPESSPSTSEADPSSTPSTPGEDDLPGERVDLYPYEGAELAVVGVAADDTLHMRTGPGTEFDILFELGPLADGFQATGHNRTVPDGPFWVEVLVDGRTGWVSAAFVAQPGQTTDITAELGELPGGETMVDIGQAVAAIRGPSEGSPPEVTVVDGPTVGDVGEITVDVVGYGDDAVSGERLHIVAEPAPGGEAFTVRTVEATVLCTRGVTDGLCV